MELQIFEDKEFGQIRTVLEENGTVLFCGSDVARALGYKNAKDALLRHCREDGVAFHDLIDSIGRTQNAKFITEGNVYRLVIHSKLPEAERFERLVMEEILPSVRKHGAYITRDTLEKLMGDPDFAIGLFEQIRDERAKNDALTRQVSELAPKAKYFDALVEKNLLTNIRQTAKELNLSERVFVKRLFDLGLCYRSPRGVVMPYSKMTDLGYAEIKEYCRGDWVGVYTLFTPEGRRFLHKKLHDVVNA